MSSGEDQRITDPGDSRTAGLRGLKEDKVDGSGQRMDSGMGNSARSSW